MQSASDQDLLKFKGVYLLCLFPKKPLVLGENDNTFGITKWEIIDVLEGEAPPGDSITITGEFFEPLKPGTMYTILAKKNIHPKYGMQYNLLYINEEVNFHNLANQRTFLSCFLTANQVEELYKVHENPMAVIADHDVDGLVKVHGVGPHIAQCIIDRFEANKDMSSVYIELNEYGLTPNFIRRLTKVYKSPAQLISAVKNNPYQLIHDVDGIGFKTADDIALRGGMNPKAKERLKAYIVFYLETEAADNGNSYVGAGELLMNLYNAFGGKENIVENVMDDEGKVLGSNVGLAMQELQDEDKIVVEQGDNKSRRRVYLKYYYDLEKNIAGHLQRLLTGANNFNYDDWEIKVKAVEDRQGFNFDKTQLHGIKLGLDSQVSLIAGGAGCGKSSLVSGILGALEGYSFAQCALSGKAAARLQEVTGSEGSTIHRLLGYNGQGKFTYNSSNKLPYDIIVLDEVSLVGGEIFLSLIEAIKDGGKLIMLGDLGQLEAIGALNLASDFYRSPEIPTVELTEVHRQAAKSGIITSAHQVRNHYQLFNSSVYDGVDVFGELQDMTFDISSDKDDIRDRTMEWFDKWYDSDLVKKDIMKIQVISPVKERGESCVYNLNLDIQETVNPVGEGSPEILCGSKEKPYHIHVGDKVMCIKNNYKTQMLKPDSGISIDGELCPIYNGWVGIVKEITADGVGVYFPLAKGIVLIGTNDSKNDLVLGYVSTVHKLQGSDAPVVIGAIDYGTPPSMLTSQLLYTLITRAKKHCVIVGQSGAIYKAIESDYVSQKRTFLKELLEVQCEQRAEA